MVRAILDGRKTQTRRVVKPQPEYIKYSVAPQELRGEPKKHPAPYLDAYCSEPKTPSNPRGMSSSWCWWDEYDRCGDGFRCPFGQPGDRLWVRENSAMDCGDGRILYQADGDDITASLDGRWIPSIHMRRENSRITLEITGVRVERLQDISRGDSMAEGCPFPNMANGPDPRRWYAELWESINGPGSWGRNPWVWVVEFRRVA